MSPFARKPVSSNTGGTNRRAASLRALFASVALLALGGTATAQDSGIRGTFDPLLQRRLPAANKAPGNRQASEGIPAPPYEPASEGTEAEAEEAGSFRSGLDQPGAPQTAGAGDPVAAPAPPPLPTEAPRDPADVTTAADAEASADAEGLPGTATMGKEDDGAATGSIRATRIGPAEQIDDVQAADPDSAAIERQNRPPEENPFAPLGIRTGTFTVFPSIEQGIETSVEDDDTTVSSQTTLRAEARSDWSRHSMNLSGFIRYDRPFSGDGEDEIEFGADAATVLDFAGGYRGTFDASIDRRREDATAPVSFVGTMDNPYRTLATVSAGLEKSIGKLETGVRASVERSDYEDGTLSDGTTFSQEDRNNTLVAATLRAGYEISPALTPFIEGEIGRRVHDLGTDRNDYARDADRLGLRAGVAFDLGEKLNGEVSAGWLRESFEDDRLEAISGLELASTVNWSPMRGTNVFFNASTQVEGTTTAGSSGSLLYNAELGFSHELLENLVAEGQLGLGYRDFAGSDIRDVIFSAEAGGTWWMNRNFGFNARAQYELEDSNDPNRGDETISIFAGIRARR